MQPQKSIMEAPPLSFQEYSSNRLELLDSKFIIGEGFSLCYDPDDQYLALGCYNGTKLLYSLKKNSFIEIALDKDNQTPITCIKWRPNSAGHSKVIATANSDGVLEYWHIPSMKRILHIEQKENSLHCCQFSPKGQSLATAGKDTHIRIYDENTKSLAVTLHGAQWNHQGHANRIFSIKFIDSNTLLSGGWDSTLHLWDLRQAKSVKSSYGPHVAGDSLDVLDGQILVGCYAPNSQIQIWDYNKFQKKEQITWLGGIDPDKVGYVYTACWSQAKKGHILAGSCGVNEVRVLKEEEGVHVLAGRIECKNGCFAVKGSKNSCQMAFATAHEGFYRYKYS